MEKNIKPIYIFDGEANILKGEERKRRADIREEMVKKKAESEDDENIVDARKYAKSDIHLSKKMMEDVRLLLKYTGIPFIEAKQDGEAQATYMINKGDAWAVSSQDYDCFLFGATRIIRNLSATHTRMVNGRKINVDIMTYNFNDVIQKLGIGQNHLVDIGIMVGVDFYKGIPKVGIQTAYKMIKKYGSIENIITHQDEESELKDVIFKFKDGELKSIRSIFLHPIVNTEYEKPTWKKIIPDKILELLYEEHSFAKDSVTSKIKRMEYLQGNKKQITLDKFHN
jgi:flap endonuclease-1